MLLFLTLLQVLELLVKNRETVENLFQCEQTWTNCNMAFVERVFPRTHAFCRLWHRFIEPSSTFWSLSKVSRKLRPLCADTSPWSSWHRTTNIALWELWFLRCQVCEKKTIDWRTCCREPTYFFTEVGPDFLIVHVLPIVLPCFTNAGQTCLPCLGSLCCIRSLPYLRPPLLQWWSTSWGLRKLLVQGHCISKHTKQ